MSLWQIDNLTQAEIIRLLGESLDPEITGPLEDMPAVLRETLLFPYTGGLTFTQRLHAGGGWAAVDAAFAKPPASTEQVIHPEKYDSRRGPDSGRPPRRPCRPHGHRLVPRHGRHAGRVPAEGLAGERRRRGRDGAGERNESGRGLGRRPRRRALRARRGDRRGDRQRVGQRRRCGRVRDPGGTRRRGAGRCRRRAYHGRRNEGVDRPRPERRRGLAAWRTFSAWPADASGARATSIRERRSRAARGHWRGSSSPLPRARAASPTVPARRGRRPWRRGRRHGTASPAPSHRP